MQKQTWKTIIKSNYKIKYIKKFTNNDLKMKMINIYNVDNMHACIACHIDNHYISTTVFPNIKIKYTHILG